MEQTPPNVADEQISGFSDEVVQQLLSFGSIITQEMNQSLGAAVDRNTGTARFCAVLALLTMIQTAPLAPSWFNWLGFVPSFCALVAFQRALNLPLLPPADPPTPTEQEWFHDGILNDPARLRQAHLASMVRCHQQRRDPEPDPVIRRWMIACVVCSALVRVVGLALSTQSR